MKRRAFLKLAAGTAALPLFSIGAAANGPGGARKIRLGLIGCGGRMGLSTGYGILNSMCGPDEEIVCLAEPDPSHWDKVRAVVKAHQPQTDTSKIRAYYDYREMLEKEAKNLDAVAIATPNHHHAPAALRAMAKGLHVYVEKPMALTVEEVRLMHAMQKRTGIVAQVGNHGHSEEGMRRLVEYIRAGTIGQVREVWSYDDRLNAMLYRPPKAEPPKGMDWDSWCGPAPVCDYYAPTQDHNGLHPHDWHDWIGYGNGSIGNMGTHIMDAAFWALDLGKAPPTTITAHEAAFACPGAWAWRDTIDFAFPARGGLPPVTLHWYDGVCPGIPYDKDHVDRFGHALKREWLNLPPILLETERKWGIAEKAPFLNMGTLFCGTKGTIWFSHHSAIRFFPKTLGKEIRKAKNFSYKTTEHTHEFYAAIRESRPANTGFDYSVPLAETLLLANVAARAGKGAVLKWDGRSITNNPAANAFLSAPCRPGWELG